MNKIDSQHKARGVEWSGGRERETRGENRTGEERREQDEEEEYQRGDIAEAPLLADGEGRGTEKARAGRLVAGEVRMYFYFFILFFYFSFYLLYKTCGIDSVNSRRGGTDFLEANRESNRANRSPVRRAGRTPRFIWTAGMFDPTVKIVILVTDVPKSNVTKAFGRSNQESRRWSRKKRITMTHSLQTALAVLNRSMTVRA